MKPIIPILLLTVTLFGSWLVTTMGDTNPLWSFIIFGAIIIYVIDKWRKNKNEDKVSYIYLLTPKGIEKKAKLTIEFLKTKIKEYQILQEEIEMLRQDINQL